MEAYIKMFNSVMNSSIKENPQNKKLCTKINIIVKT